MFARIGFVTASGTQLAAAGIDCLVLRDLMGHHGETTAACVHLAPKMIAAD